MSVLDYVTPTSCGQCSELIRESDMNAGEYATRDNHETLLHQNCADAFDAENPRRAGEDDTPTDKRAPKLECATCGVVRTEMNADGHDWIEA